jgi:hypothetical protein
MMNFFGGPFRGKTTAAGLCKSHGIAVWETDEERAKLPGWNEQLWQAWKIDHPLHHEWERLNKIHQWNKSTARKRRFITFSHDPSTETENVLLYMGPSQLARIQGRPEKYGHARVEASKHWEARPQEQDGRNFTHPRYFTTAHATAQAWPFLLRAGTEASFSWTSICSVRSKWERVPYGSGTRIPVIT